MRTIDIMIVYIHPIGEEARDLLILLWLLKSRRAELCKVVGRGGGGGEFGFTRKVRPFTSR